MNLLVTGGAGFIGSNYVRYLLQNRRPNRVIVYDALTYAGNRASLSDVWHDPHFRFWEGYIQDEERLHEVIEKEQVSHIVNFAAESHNDRSLLESGRFIQTNTFGVHVLLEATRRFNIERLVHVSTDEVYGSITEGEFTEESPLMPNTPYSASKAGGDLLCRAHFVLFKIPVVITRGGNNYGPYQYPEKLISIFTVRLLEGKKVPLYGEGEQVREFIHVLDHCSGIDAVLLKGESGEVYNVGDKNERRNIDTVRVLLDETGRDMSFVKKIPDPRKGAHDARYSMSTTKLEALGWKPRQDFDQELRETVRWYKENESWWMAITDKPEYKQFIRTFYGPGLGQDL